MNTNNDIKKTTANIKPAVFNDVLISSFIIIFK